MKKRLALQLIVSVAVFATIAGTASALPPEAFSGTWRDVDLNSPYNQVREYMFTLNPAPVSPPPGWKPNGNYTITWRYASSGSVVSASGNPLTKTWREHPYKPSTIVVDISGTPTDCGWKLDKTKAPWELHLTPAGSFPIRLVRASGGTPTTTIPLDYHGKWTEKGSTNEYEIDRYTSRYRINSGPWRACTYTNDGLSGYVDLGAGVGRVYVIDPDHLILLTGSGYKELVGVAGKYVGEWEDVANTVTLKLKTGRAYEITKGTLGSAPASGSWSYNSGTNRIELDPSGVAEKLLITGSDQLIHTGTPVVLERKGGPVSGGLVPPELLNKWYMNNIGDTERVEYEIRNIGTATEYRVTKWTKPTSGGWPPYTAASPFPGTLAPDAPSSAWKTCTYDSSNNKLALQGIGDFTVDKTHLFDANPSIELTPIPAAPSIPWWRILY